MAKTEILIRVALPCEEARKMLVRAILHASLLSVAACWVVPGSPPVDVRRRHRALPRTAAPVACAPFRSDADFDYFRRSKELTIELTKEAPLRLGAVLEAPQPDGGVQVAAGCRHRGGRLRQ